MTQEEIEKAESVLKKYNVKIVDIIEYTLPTEEKFLRYLIVVSR